MAEIQNRTCRREIFRAVFTVFLLIFTAFPLCSKDADPLPEKRRSYFVQLNSFPSDPEVFLLSCSVLEQAVSLHSSFSNTTKLPVLPMRIGKWEESCYVLPGTAPGFRKVKLQKDMEFRFPETGISRKALLTKSKENPGAFLLTLFWFEGTIHEGKYQSLQIFTTLELSGSDPVQIWPPEETGK